MTDFARLRRLKNDDQLRRVREIAQYEGHACFDPTHAIWKDGDIVGHFSIGAMPIVMGHLPNGMSPRDSFNLISVAEDIAASQFRHVYFPVSKESPFNPLMEGLGFRQLVDVTMYHKSLIV